MKTLDKFTGDQLKEKNIKYISQDNKLLLYKDKEHIYYFKPINIKQIEDIPFIDSNDCEFYQLIKKYKLE